MGLGLAEQLSVGSGDLTLKRLLGASGIWQQGWAFYEFVGPVNSPLSGLTAAGSTTAGVLGASLGLAGLTAAGSTTAGVLGATLPLAGDCAGAANVSGALGALLSLTGDSAGAATVSGALGALLSLAGDSAGAANVSGALGALLSLAGDSAGAANVSGALGALLSLAGQSDAAATAAAQLLADLLLSGQASGTSSASGLLGLGTTPLDLGSPTASGTSGGGGSLLVLLPMVNLGSPTASGTSGGGGSLSVSSGGFVNLGSVSTQGVGTLLGVLTVVWADEPAVPIDEPPMKQRIHNALMALCKAGPYYPCRIDSKTGLMVVDKTKNIKPAGITIKEISSSYRQAESFRRYLTDEIETWVWVARIQFPNQEVSFEEFERNLTARTIHIPPAEGMVDMRPILARLSACDYFPPPEQSPSGGMLADFTFNILPETLRK